MNTQTREIRLKQVRPNPNQPRQHFDEDKLQELANSISKFGVIQPITVVEKEEEGETFYLIVAGERRWRASKLAEKETIPVNVMDFSELEVREISLIENIQREDLDPIEEAKAYTELMGIHGCTQEELAERLSVSQGAISNRIRLLQLSEPVKEKVSEGEISATQARTLAAIKDPKKQAEIAEEVVETKANSKKTEELVKEAKAEEKNKEKFKPFIEEAEKKGIKFIYHFPVDRGVMASLYQELQDKSFCTGCNDLAGMVENDKLVKVCLNKECFVNLQKTITEEEKQKIIDNAVAEIKAQGKTPIFLEEAKNFKLHSLGEFNKEDCQKCDNNKTLINIPSEGEIEVRDICLDSSCFENKEQKAIEQIEANRKAKEAEHKANFEKEITKWYGSVTNHAKEGINAEQLASTLFTMYTVLSAEGYISEFIIEELNHLWGYEQNPIFNDFVAIEDKEKLISMLVQLTFSLHRAWYLDDPEGCQDGTNTLDIIALMTGKEVEVIEKGELEVEVTDYWEDVRDSKKVLAVKNWNPSKGKVKMTIQELTDKELQFVAKVESRDNVKKSIMAEIKRRKLEIPKEPTELPSTGALEDIKESEVA